MPRGGTREGPILTPELVARVDRAFPQDPDPNRIPMTDADYSEQVERIAAGWPGTALWVFGYGSLLWNPGFGYEERRSARLYGWHRAFCMQLLRFRGSPEQPGLMLALERGGSCHGEVFRLRADRLWQDVGTLLRREVPYRRLAQAWRWVDVVCGPDRLRALTFYAGMRRDLFYVSLPIQQQARMLARAAGHGGSGAAYLQQTVAKLAELGIHDTYLWELQRLVAAEIHALEPGACQPQASDNT